GSSLRRRHHRGDSDGRSAHDPRPGRSADRAAVGRLAQGTSASARLTMAADPGPAARPSIPGERSDHFLDVVARQRACRDFSKDEVPDVAIDQLLTAATRAPSAMNHQPWVFVVVRAPPARVALAEIMWELWDAAGRAATVGRVPDGLLRDVDEGFRT